MLRSEGESISTHASNLIICSFNIMEKIRGSLCLPYFETKPLWVERWEGKWPPVARQMHNGSFVKEEIAKHNKEWPESEARTQGAVSGTRRMDIIHPEKAGPWMDTVWTSDCPHFPLPMKQWSACDLNPGIRWGPACHSTIPRTIQCCRGKGALGQSFAETCCHPV